MGGEGSLCGCLLPHATERLVGFLSHRVANCIFGQNKKSSSGQILRRWGTAVTLKKRDGQVRYVADIHSPNSAMSVPDFSL